LPIDNEIPLLAAPGAPYSSVLTLPYTRSIPQRVPNQQSDLIFSQVHDGRMFYFHPAIL